MAAGLAAAADARGWGAAASGSAAAPSGWAADSGRVAADPAAAVAPGLAAGPSPEMAGGLFSCLEAVAWLGLKAVAVQSRLVAAGEIFAACPAAVARRQRWLAPAKRGVGMHSAHTSRECGGASSSEPKRPARSSTRVPSSVDADALVKGGFVIGGA